MIMSPRSMSYSTAGLLIPDDLDMSMANCPDPGQWRKSIEPLHFDLELSCLMLISPTHHDFQGVRIY